jgi:trans-aconitate 2-methyltransferase
LTEVAERARPTARDWNSDLYLEFEEERTRAARDLLARIPLYEARSVIDLGCGPGNSTELLTRAFPGANVVGIDKSDNMLAVARARVPAAHFVKGDIEQWEPDAPVDVIFANAALHFLPDHRRHIARLFACLAPCGRLAVQMPDMTHELSHAAMRMVAADGPWADRLVPVAKSLTVIGRADEYYDLFAPLCRVMDIWRTIYIHPLDGPDRVVDWFEGSGLRPFLDLLSAQEVLDFLARYREKLAEAYQRQPDGKVLLRYPRLFFILQK